MLWENLSFILPAPLCGKCKYYYSPSEDIEIKEKGSYSSQIKWKINSWGKTKSIFSDPHVLSLKYATSIIIITYVNENDDFSLNEKDLYSKKEFVYLKESCYIIYKHSNTLTDFKACLVDSHKNTTCTVSWFSLPKEDSKKEGNCMHLWFTGIEQL